ncbi:MAG: hypothetical protein ACK5NA_04275 [Enterococcus sp.]
MADSIYVHIDTTSNAVLTKGLNANDFSNSIVHQPKNLLLLDPSSSYGEYDAHTGLKTIRGSENVAKFFRSLHDSRDTDDLKWIDFTDLTMLKELTPLEISELLYFGHMKTHLHSPFFYKLQNNFVYFDLANDLSRIYYRYLDEFYRILADKLTFILSKKINIKKNFFRKDIPTSRIDSELLKEMRSIMQEGVIFCFDQIGLENNQYKIPIYVLEDYVWKTKGNQYRKEEIIATLIYHADTQKWHLNYESEDFSYLSFK